MIDVTTSDFANFEGFPNTTNNEDIRGEEKEEDISWAASFQSTEENEKNENNEIEKDDKAKIDDITWASDFQTFDDNSHSFENSGFDSFSEGYFQTFESTNINTETVKVSEADFQGFQKAQQDVASQLMKDNFGQTGNSIKADENNDVKSLETLFMESCLCQQIQEEATNLDPVKSENLMFFKNKLELLTSSLDSSKGKEDWLVRIETDKLGLFRSHFDFHLTPNDTPKSRSKSTPTTLTNKNARISNGHHVIKPGSPPPKEIEDILAPKLPASATIKVKTPSQSEVYVTSAKSLQQEAEMKKCMIELSSKNVEDLRSIVNELEIEAKIYSELLLSELDYREKLLRQQEIKNTFISKHLTVERKINEAKKKKKGYGFFKGTEDASTKCLEWSIPYFEHDDGPSTRELNLITELLSAINKDDPDLPRLISEYMFKCDIFELDTVIQVRTQNGVESISNTPSSR